jgi:hypothetical protein
MAMPTNWCVREVDRILDDVALLLVCRLDVDHAVGDEEGLWVGRDVHREHAAQSALGAQTGVRGEHRFDELRRVQTALR